MKKKAAQKTTGITTAKVPVDLVRKARVVATIRSMDIQEYIESVLRPAIEADYRKAIQDEAKGL